MKKLIVVCLLFVWFCIPAGAAETAESYYDEMIDFAGNDIENFLQGIGIESGNFDELLNINFKNVIKQLLELCRNEMKEPFSVVISCCILMLLLSVVQTLLDANSGIADFFSFVGTVMIAFTILLPVSRVLADVLSVSVATVDFMHLLIPVFAGIITVFGKPTLAVCLQGTCFSTAQILASFFETSLGPVCVAYTSLSVCAGFSSHINTNHIAQLIKKTYITILSFFSAVFSGFLSVKAVIASVADTVTIKGVKFIIGNAVPVVGGALSDALNSVISGVSLLKSTVGIFAVMILILISLPTLTELLLWSFGLKILSAIAALTGQTRDEMLFESFAGVFSVMIAVVAYQAFLYVISVSVIAITTGMR